MKKTTLTIVIEHHDEGEFQTAIREVYDRLIDGYQSGNYIPQSDVDVEVTFKREEEEA